MDLQWRHCNSFCIWLCISADPLVPRLQGLHHPAVYPAMDTQRVAIDDTSFPTWICWDMAKCFPSNSDSFSWYGKQLKHVGTVTPSSMHFGILPFGALRSPILRPYVGILLKSLLNYWGWFTFGFSCYSYWIPQSYRPHTFLELQLDRVNRTTCRRALDPREWGVSEGSSWGEPPSFDRAMDELHDGSHGNSQPATRWCPIVS